MPTFSKRSAIPVPVEDLFAYHARPGALDRLLPPWQKVDIVERGGITNGERVTLKMHGVPSFTWVAEHHSYVENQQFSDRALKGPFKRWNHHHRFLPDFAHTAVLEDAVDYALPGYAFFMAGKVRRDLERMFAFRHARTRNDLARHGQFRDAPRQTVAITGATGLIGGTLAPFLSVGGHRVIPVARTARSSGVGETPMTWNPSTGELANYRPVDTFVHLAGRSIAQRWSQKVMAEIVSSRVDATRALCRFLAGRPEHDRPKLLIAASAIGFYGDRGEEELTESSPAGDPQKSFFAATCDAWEKATKVAEDAGIRTIHLRIGVVVTPKGGAVAKLITPTKLGVAGPLGSGQQWMPWIELDDLIGLIHHLAMTPPPLSGPINGVAPNPVRQRDFARTLARVLHRPAFMPMPAFVVKTLFGQMGKEALLASTRVLPTRVPADFSYLYPTLEAAIRGEMGL